jgi:hydrogenase maturation protease
LSKKRAVIGLGNILRRDDGIGIAVLESLLMRYKRDEIEYLDFGSASFDLIYRLKEYDTVLLIDAIDAGLPPATLRIFGLNEVSLTLPGAPVSSHELNLKGIFELCVKFEVKTRIYVAGIQAAEVGYAQGLSGTLQKELDSLVEAVASFIDTQLCK